MFLSHSLRVQVGGGGGGGGGEAADGLRLRNIRSVAATMQTTMTRALSEFSLPMIV